MFFSLLIAGKGVQESEVEESSCSSQAVPARNGPFIESCISLLVFIHRLDKTARIKWSENLNSVTDGNLANADDCSVAAKVLFKNLFRSFFP